MTRILPVLLLIVFTLLYGLSAVNGVSTADNAEFQLVSTQFGLAHPPGFPLYTITSHLFTRLPLPVNAAVKANLFAAVTSALTLVFVYLSIETVAARRDTARRVPTGVMGITGAVILGTSTTFWAQATVANVRSMTGLFTAVALWSLVRLWQERERRGLWAAVFTLAISFGVTHHLSLVFIGIVMGGWVIGMWRTVPIRQFLLAPFGLLPLLYLPLREPSLREWDAFWHYALARGFESDFFYFVTADTLIPRLRVMLDVFLLQFDWPILILTLIGLAWLVWKRRPLALLIISMFTVHTLITATYRAPQTVEYMLPVYILVAIAAACVPMWITSLFSTTEAQRSRRFSFYGLGGTVLAFVGIGLGVWQGWGNFGSFVHLRDAAVSDSYTLPIMNDAPQNAHILTNWHWYTAFRFQQEVNGVRPDINITFVDPTMRWGEAIVASAGERPTIATNWNESMAVPPPMPFHEAFLFGADAVGEMVSADIPLNGNLKITGYAIEQSTVSLDEEIVVTVRWEGTAGMSLFAHLVDENGRLLAQDDVSVTNNPVQLRLTPRPGTVPGMHTILLGTAGSERMPLVDLQVTESVWRPITRNPMSIEHEGKILVGYDTDWTLEGRPRTYLHWKNERQNERNYYTQTIDEPAVQIGDVTLTDERGRHYVPMGYGIVWMGADVSNLNNVAAGERVEMAQAFGSVRPVVRDLAVSVALTAYAEDGVTWVWREQDDTVPAMGGIPTLKWVAGSRVHDPHWIDVLDVDTGQKMIGTVKMYDAFTNRVVPILDERIVEQGQGIPFWSR